METRFTIKFGKTLSIDEIEKLVDDTNKLAKKFNCSIDFVRGRKDTIEDSNCTIPDVSGMLPLTALAKQKLEYINGSCIAREFPNNEPTKEWAGAVLDLLEELKLGNYH